MKRRLLALGRAACGVLVAAAMVAWAVEQASLGLAFPTLLALACTLPFLNDARRSVLAAWTRAEENGPAGSPASAA